MWKELIPAFLAWFQVVSYLYEIETCMAATVYEHLGTRRLYLSPRGGHTILVVSRAQ